MASTQDEIRKIYVCHSGEHHCFVVSFLEQGTRPRAILRLQSKSTPGVFIEFPSLPFPALEKRVEENVRAFADHFNSPIFTIEVPSGFSLDDVVDWLDAHAPLSVALRRVVH